MGPYGRSPEDSSIVIPASAAVASVTGDISVFVEQSYFRNPLAFVTKLATASTE